MNKVLLPYLEVREVEQQVQMELLDQEEQEIHHQQVHLKEIMVEVITLHLLF
jgi:hypothetical protein